LQKPAVVLAKNANIYAKCFCENILQIITSVPGANLCCLKLASPPFSAVLNI
jgi:hypothetical protein